MNANRIDSRILGANFLGQGSGIAVGRGLSATLRSFCANYLRGFGLCLASWRALKRMPAVATPGKATRPTTSVGRQERHWRLMPGVVVDPGTVGVR